MGVERLFKSSPQWARQFFIARDFCGLALGQF
jgi:hypothetical protein